MTSIRKLVSLAALLAAIGCSGQIDPVRVPDKPMQTCALVPLRGDARQARNLVVLVPGALSSVHIFDGYLPRIKPGTAVLGYRFPGLDGRPMDGKVRIAQAGAQIAACVKQRSFAKVRLIGLSTGGPIVLEAARRIKGPAVEVGLISTALPTPATLFSSAAALFDIAAAATRAKTFDLRHVWGEYYRTLLFGRNHFSNAQRAAQSARILASNVDRLVLPRKGMARAHGGDLLNWRLGDAQDLSGVRILFLHGALDPVFPVAGARRLAARLPSSKFIAYPESGHLLFSTEPTLFDDLDRTFRTWESD